MKRRHEIGSDYSGASQNEQTENSDTHDIRKKDVSSEDASSEETSGEETVSEYASNEDYRIEGVFSDETTSDPWFSVLYKVLDHIPLTNENELIKDRIRNLMHILSYKPNDATVHYQLGFELSKIVSSKILPAGEPRLFNNNAKKKAVEHLKKAIPLESAHIDTYRLFRKIYTALCHDHLREAISLKPYYVDPYLVLRKLNALMGHERTMLLGILLNMRPTTDNQKIQLYLEIAETYLDLNLPDKAIEYLQEVISKDPTNTQANTLLEDAQIKKIFVYPHIFSEKEQQWTLDHLPVTKENELSKSIIRNLMQILANNPDDETVLYQLGLELSQIVNSKNLAVGDPYIDEYGVERMVLKTRALVYLRQAIALKPNYIDAYRLIYKLKALVPSWAEKDEREILLQLLLDTLSTTDDQKNIKAYLDIAQIYLDKSRCNNDEDKNKDKATEYLQKVISQDPTNAQANILLGKELVSSDPKKAIDYFTTALKGDDTNAEAHYQLGRAYYGFTEILAERNADSEEIDSTFNGSLKALDRAIELKLSSPQDYFLAYSLRGAIYLKFGKIEEAIWSYFQEARFNDSHGFTDPDTLSLLDKIDEKMLERMKDHPNPEIGWLAWAIDAQYKKSQKPPEEFFGVNFMSTNYALDDLIQDYSLLEKGHQKKIERAKVFLTKGAKDPNCFFFFGMPSELQNRVLETIRQLPLQIEDDKVVYPEATPSPQ